MGLLLQGSAVPDSFFSAQKERQERVRRIEAAWPDAVCCFGGTDLQMQPAKASPMQAMRKRADEQASRVACKSGACRAVTLPFGSIFSAERNAFRLASSPIVCRRIRRSARKLKLRPLRPTTSFVPAEPPNATDTGTITLRTVNCAMYRWQRKLLPFFQPSMVACAERLGSALLRSARTAPSFLERRSCETNTERNAPQMRVICSLLQPLSRPLALSPSRFRPRLFFPPLQAGRECAQLHHASDLPPVEWVCISLTGLQVTLGHTKQIYEERAQRVYAPDQGHSTGLGATAPSAPISLASSVAMSSASSSNPKISALDAMREGVSDLGSGTNLVSPHSLVS